MHFLILYFVACLLIGFAGRKRRIRASRVDGTRLLADALAGLARRPGVLVSASAVGSTPWLRDSSAPSS